MYKEYKDLSWKQQPQKTPCIILKHECLRRVHVVDERNDLNLSYILILMNNWWASNNKLLLAF